MRGLRAVDHALQIHVQQRLNFIGGLLDDWPAMADAGIVEHNVDPATSRR